MSEVGSPFVIIALVWAGTLNCIAGKIVKSLLVGCTGLFADELARAYLLCCVFQNSGERSFLWDLESAQRESAHWYVKATKVDR